MTPEQQYELQDLFMEARRTARATASEYLTADGMRVAIADDDAAVKAFMEALARLTTR